MNASVPINTSWYLICQGSGWAMLIQGSICETPCVCGTNRKPGSKNENAWKTAHFSQVVKLNKKQKHLNPYCVPFFLAKYFGELQIHNQTNAVKSTALESWRSSFESQPILLPVDLWEDDLICLSLSLLISKLVITLLIPQFVRIK